MRLSVYRIALGGGLIVSATIGAMVLQEHLSGYLARAATRPGNAATVLPPPRLEDGVHAYEVISTEAPADLTSSHEPNSLILASLQAQLQALQSELEAARQPPPRPVTRGAATDGKREREARESPLIVFSADVESVGLAGIRSGDQFRAQLTSDAIAGQTVTATILNGPLAASRLVGRVSGRQIRFDRLQPPDGPELRVAASAAVGGFSNRQLARAAGLTVTQAVAGATIGTAGAAGGRFGEQLAAGIVRGGSRSGQRLIEDELNRIDLPMGSIITVIVD